MQVQPYIPEDIEEEVIEQRVDTIAKEMRDEIETQFLSAYKPDRKPEPKDTLGEYTIQIGQPLQEFTTQHAKAYAANHVENPARKLFALVCSNQNPARVKLAKQLLNKPHPNLLHMVACGSVMLSRPEEERFVIIYERPVGKNLADIVAEQMRPLPDRFLREKIIGPVGSVLQHLQDLGFTHGRINPHNIFFGEQVMVGDCVSEPCGASQDFRYEPIGRIQCSPDTGKGQGIIQNDFHALGAVIVLLKFKPPIFQEQDRQRFLSRLLREGAYMALVGYRDLSEEMSDFLRGCLHDSPYERWSNKQVKQWVQGKRYNLLPPSLSSSGARVIPFAEQNFQNLRSLSNAMHQQWAPSIQIMRDGSLTRWVEVGMHRKDISDGVSRAVKSLGGGQNRTDKQNSELIARVLVLMDPFSPVRMKHLAVYLDGLGQALADCYVRKDDAGITLIMDMIEQGLPSIWAECQKRYLGVDGEIPDDLQSVVSSLEKARINLRAQGMGFGIERMMYDLNPQLPCMSPLLKGRYVTNMEQLLRVLDELAPQMVNKEVPIDRHIAAYIASQLAMTKDMSFMEFKGYPDVQKHGALVGLKFLQQAQSRSGNIKLPGLASWIACSISTIVENWQGKTIREHVCKVLKPMALKGNLGPMLDFLAQYDYTLADKSGFLEASRNYHAMAEEIINQSDDFVRDIRTLHYGSMVAKSLSYVVFIVVVYMFCF